jgi:hypothetical protein
VGSAAAGEGVWVLGLIRGSAADAAGIRQGDQLLALDGAPLAGQTPFAVASLLQGQEGEAAAEPGLGLQGAPVQLKVCGGGRGRAWDACGAARLSCAAIRPHPAGPPDCAAQAARPDPPCAAPGPSPCAPQVRGFDGGERVVTLQRPTRVLPSPVTTRLETGPGGERVGVIKLANFNARAQVRLAATRTSNLPGAHPQRLLALLLLPAPAALPARP